MKSPSELSFLPEDYLERKARRRANVVCGILSVVVMGAIGTAFTLTDKSMRAVEEHHNSIDHAYTEAARRIDQVNQMRAQQARIVQQAELASSLVERVPRSNLLAEFTNALPAGVSLLELSMTSTVRTDAAAAPKTAFEAAKAARDAAAKKGPEAPQAKVYDVALKLTGLADSDVQVSEFIARLNLSPLLRDVNLVVTELDKQQERVMRKFQIDMTLNPNAEVTEDAQATATAATGGGEPGATTLPAEATAGGADALTPQN
jgi:Tfp pilus assembly protein PilN